MPTHHEEINGRYKRSEIRITGVVVEIRTGYIRNTRLARAATPNYSVI
jgi:hypothetical protein